MQIKMKLSLAVFLTLFSSFLFAWDPITNLYFSSRNGMDVFIRKANIDDSFNLKQFLKTNNIVEKSFIKYAPATLWEYGTNKLIQQSDKREPYDYEITPEQFPQFLAQAKIILKSFLLKNDSEFNTIKETSIKKSGIDRLFTYKKLQTTIENKRLTRVILPRKIMVIKNLVTGEYVKNEDAHKIIDTITKIVAIGVNPLSIRIDAEDLNYDLEIYAEKITPIEDSFGKPTCDELLSLVNEAPFDVGFGNIFRDKNDNAIIIDTAFKGEPADTSAGKIKARYCKQD